jgi:hypothetical protein
MAGETLHETGITVTTPMSTSYIRIDTVIKTGDGRLGQNRLGKDLLDLHESYYNEEIRKSKVSLYGWGKKWGLLDREVK